MPLLQEFTMHWLLALVIVAIWDVGINGRVRGGVVDSGERSRESNSGQDSGYAAFRTGASLERGHKK